MFTALSGAAAERPNVLFIAVDDLRPELGCYGADYIRSPNLDRLAARAVRFDRAYCQYAICGPSRASLLTGLRPDALKIEDIDTYFRRTVPDVVTLPQHFKAHGYVTRYVGKVFHRGQEDNEHSWSALPPKAVAGAGGEYQLEASREVVRVRRAEALAKYGPSRLEGLTGGPAWEAADAPEVAYVDGRIARAGRQLLRDLQGQPFFLAVGFHKPHLPFVAPKKYFDLYDPQRMPLARHASAPSGGPALARHSSFELRTRSLVPLDGPIDTALARELRRAYAACVSFIDAQIGILLDELDALGLREKTIVVVWGDHGWHLGELGCWGKATNYEIATRVPLLVAAPGAVAGKGSAALVEFVDVYPTLCDLAGLPPPRHLEGASFAALLREPDRAWKHGAFSQFPTPALREWAARPLSPGMRETRFGPLIARVEDQLAREHGGRFEREFFERNVMGYSLRTDRYRLVAWVDRRQPAAKPLAIELYDHRHDPDETENIAGRPAERAIVAELQRRLLAGWRAARPRD